MTTINLKTNDLVVTATTKPTIATGGVASIQIIVDFNSTWDGYSKSAIFYTSKNPTPYEVVLTGGTNCKIPKEVLLDECILYIALKGVKSNGAVKASAVVKYRVVPGSPTVVISDPSDDVYNQMLADYGKMTERFIFKGSIDPACSLKINFSGRICAIVTVNSSFATGYATYLVQGYGKTGSRLHVTELSKGEVYSYVVSDTEEALSIINSDSVHDYDCSVLMIQGGAPTITEVTEVN